MKLLIVTYGTIKLKKRRFLNISYKFPELRAIYVLKKLHVEVDLRTYSLRTVRT
jgi:hypothetical protein